MKSSRLRAIALEIERKEEEELKLHIIKEQQEQERREEEAFREKEEVIRGIRRFTHLMHSSINLVGRAVEVGTDISVYWKDDDEWYDGSIDSYDPKNGVHGVLYCDGEHEDLLLNEEKFKIVSYPKSSPPMIHDNPDFNSSYSSNSASSYQQVQYIEDFILPIEIMLASPPRNIYGR